MNSMTGKLGEVNEERASLAAFYSVDTVEDAYVALKDLSLMMEDSVDFREDDDLDGFRSNLIKMAGMLVYMSDIIDFLKANKKE
jgi:hypothetical protein